MGGSSRPADPKVTPFVEPEAPRNPVPNWFANRGMGTAPQPFTASRNPLGEGGFDWRQPAMQSAPVADPAPAMPQFAPQTAPVAPMQAPAMSTPMVPFAIPTQPERVAMQNTLPAFAPTDPGSLETNAFVRAGVMGEADPNAAFRRMRLQRGGYGNDDANNANKAMMEAKAARRFGINGWSG